MFCGMFKKHKKTYGFCCEKLSEIKFNKIIWCLLLLPNGKFIIVK
jgi:hypothetical protein